MRKMRLLCFRHGGSGSCRQVGVQWVPPGVMSFCSIVTWSHSTNPAREAAPIPNINNVTRQDREMMSPMLWRTKLNYFLRHVSERGAKPSSPNPEAALWAPDQLFWWQREAGLCANLWSYLLKTYFKLPYMYGICISLKLRLLNH